MMYWLELSSKAISELSGDHAGGHLYLLIVAGIVAFLGFVLVRTPGVLKREFEKALERDRSTMHF